MTDVIAILNAIEEEEIFEYVIQHHADAMVAALVEDKPSLKDKDDILQLADHYIGEGLVEHVMENYSDQIEPQAIKLLEGGEYVIFELEDLRKALRFGELETVVRNELVKRGVPPWG